MVPRLGSEVLFGSVNMRYWTSDAKQSPELRKKMWAIDTILVLSTSSDSTM